MKSKGVIHNVAASVIQETTSDSRSLDSLNNPPRVNKIDKATAEAVLAEIKAKHGDPDLPFEVEIDEDYDDPELLEIVEQHKQDLKNGVKGIPWEQVKRNV